MKGVKTCPKCKTENGCRVNTCVNCKFDFKSVRVKKVVRSAERGFTRVDENFDWRSLSRGDKIKVVNGSGSYYKLEDGNKIGLGYSGIFTILYVDKYGIHATSKDESGHCYIYMGKTRKSISGSILKRHKISKVLKRE